MFILGPIYAAVSLVQWFLTFSCLYAFNILSHVVVTPSHKIISLLLNNYILLLLGSIMGISDT